MVAGVEGCNRKLVKNFLVEAGIRVEAGMVEAGALGSELFGELDLLVSRNPCGQLMAGKNGGGRSTGE